MSAPELIGWERLRHGGLLLDPARSRRFANEVRPPVGWHNELELRKHLAALPETRADVSAFARFVLEELCGFTNGNGRWTRGSDVDASLGRRGLGGELIKPRWMWRGADEGVLPVFFDSEARVGVGRGKRAASQVVQWLRAGTERIALLTNGHEWRLIYGSLDADAWCEWDADLWLEEGQLSPQVSCLRILLSPKLWTPEAKNGHPPLVQAVLDSRNGQAELSAALGERVREAVELIVQSHGEPLKSECAGVEPSFIYRAAVRMVMRMVVILFAESRDLLPRDNALYFGSYGLSGLLTELEKSGARGLGRLGGSHNAWPRLLALFRLVHDGSHHPALPVPAYGGELFAPGETGSIDGLQKAIGVFETACFDQELVSDRDVLHMLQRLTRTQVRIRQGKSSTTITAPVDFSDLSSEYIGILYEGLLDFELKTAPADDPVIFLGIGNQPALPLSRLDEMDDKALASLLEKMKDTSKASVDEADEEAEDEDSAEADAEEGEGESEVGDEESATESDAGAADDKRQIARTRAEVWARRAVVAGKLVKKPRAPITAEKTARYEEEVGAKARQLVTRVVLGGEWFLVRWGGTRKGSGTFYTRPGLAVPTVQRTLRPLAYDPPVGADGKPNLDAPAVDWVPKTADEILSIKVCDPACGSGTFPVAALRFLTEALHVSHHQHGTAPAQEDDDQRFKAELRRKVVERCIYGVDLDPLAVELCRLALWIETMDRSLPFSFLDHKIKAGNSLVGAWFDTYQHYPAMAWKKRDALTRESAIKAFVKSHVTPALRDLLSGKTLFFEGPEDDPLTVHAEAMAGFERIHLLPEHETAERARLYKELRSSSAYLTLKEAMDLWCACWFWPLDALEHAPLPTTIDDASEGTAATLVALMARKPDFQFFHWELEFPDVFGPERKGFDAILGNPPWDVAKPNSKEFFSNIDPLYRSYGKQDALKYQRTYFEQPGVEREWELYNDDFKARSNFVGNAANPFGDPDLEEGDSYTIATGKKGAELHDEWRRRRASGRGYADNAHPFRHQGSADVNLYKLFLEHAHALLRDGGRLGFIVPSGLYSDHGTGALRRLLLDACKWEWLFGFENRDKIFEIHRSYKFNPIIVVKGGRTEAIRTAFMRRKLEDWERAEDFATPYSRAQVDQFSPRSKAILEIQSARDLEILEKIYKNSVLLGDDSPDGWGITYSREFDMTNDSKLFPPRPAWEALGYRPDEYSRWLKGHWRPIAELWPELKIDPTRVVPIDPDCERRMAEPDVQRTSWRVRCAQPPYDSLPIPRADIPAGIILSREGDAWIRTSEIEDTALPLYQGVMMGPLESNAAKYLGGAGHKAQWRGSDAFSEDVSPQFLLGKSDLLHHGDRLAIAFRALARSTDTRTFIATIIDASPCGNSLGLLSASGGALDVAGLGACLSSFVFDWALRRRVAGTNVNWFFIEESPAPTRERLSPQFAVLSMSTALAGRRFASHAIKHRELLTGPWKAGWATTEEARVQRLAQVAVLSSLAFGLTAEDLGRILADCGHSADELATLDDSLDPTGFWRVDRSLPASERLTTRSVAALHRLEALIKASGRPAGPVPATLMSLVYSDSTNGAVLYGDWQWAQTSEESWRECEIHAANLAPEVMA